MVLPDVYEIRIYSIDGVLTQKIKRDFVFEPPKVEQLSGGGFMVSARTRLGPIHQYKNEINMIEIFEVKGEAELDMELRFLLDFYSRDWKFLGSYELPDWTKLITIDSSDKFYFVSLDPFPKVLRSSLVIY